MWLRNQAQAVSSRLLKQPTEILCLGYTNGLAMYTNFAVLV